MTGRKLSILPEILAYPNWRHRVHLGNGLCTMGYNSIENDWEFYGMLENVKGKSVLDLGANDGYYSFKAEEKGASAVTAMDIYWGDGSTMVGGWPLEGITLLKTYLKSNVVIRPSSVYNIEELQQQWDIVLCNDLLSWLDDIPRALDCMTAACNEKLVIHDTFNTDNGLADIQIREIGIAKLYRMRLGYLKAELQKRGFNNIEVKRVYSFKHYIWQAEHFPPANSDEVIDIYDSPIEGKVIAQKRVHNTWVLESFKDFVYLREMGWAHKNNLKITNKQLGFWVRQFRKILPDMVLDWWYTRNDKESNTNEFVITATR